MATVYVSKSGLSTNSGASYALSLDTISHGITAAGASGTVIVGSGLYNEKLTTTATVTIYCDGIVVLDGTGVANNNPAIYSTANVTQTLTILPYTSGGLLVVQNHIASSLISSTYIYTGVNITNAILLSNSNTYAYSAASGTTDNYASALTLTNVIFSGFPNPIYINQTQTSLANSVACYNCTFYNGTTGIVLSSAVTYVLTISQCIFSNFTTAFNTAGIVSYLNDNLYYTITNWILAGVTYTTLPQVQALNVNYDSRSQVGNPNFVDPTNNVFYLKQASPLAPNINVGMYPYSYTRGNGYNPDSTWNIIAAAGHDNSGWYNPDGNVTRNGTTGYFELTGGTLGVIWSPVIDSTLVGNKTTRVDLAVDQYWPTNMIDTTIGDVRPNYQTVEVRASDGSFSQDNGVVAWTEVKANMAFTAISGRYLQCRLSLRSNDVAA